MKKQLLAAAIAAAVAVPMSATAGDVTLYGVLHMSVDSYDCDGHDCSDPGGTDMDSANHMSDVVGVNSHFTRFGIKGTEDLGNGLSAFFQMEFHLVDAEAGGDLNNNRNTFVGLAGDWGKVGIGKNDSPYKKSTGSLELFGSQQGDYQGIGFDDQRLSNQVFYYSPNWNGFSVGAAVSMPADVSMGHNADGVEAVSLAAVYKNGPFFASLAYETLSEDMLWTTADPTDSDYDKWRLGLGYTANGFHVGYIYEDRSDTGGMEGNDEDSWQLSGSYTMGNNVAKIAYGELDGENSDDDAELWSIGLDHKLSKRTKLYAVYADYDHDDNAKDWDSFGVGIVHKF